jgi:hypothetical protein
MKRLEIVFCLLGGALFWLLLRRFGVHALLDPLMQQGPRFFLIMIPTAISYLLFCLAFWIMLGAAARRAVSFTRLFFVSIAGFSLNYLTPFIALGGEPLKMWILSKSLGRQKAIGSVVAYNALHVLSHLFIFALACGIGFRLAPLNAARSILLITGMMISIALIAIILSCHERGISTRLFGLLTRLRLPGLTSARLVGWQERLGRYDDQITRFYREERRTFWLALGVDFLGRAIWATEMTVMFLNLGRWLSPLRAFFLHSVSSLRLVLSFLVPYELGVKEGVLCLCLQWIGLDPSSGIYLGVASRLREAIWILVGLAIMFSFGIRRLPLFSPHSAWTKETE